MISRSYPKTGEWIMVGDKVILDEVHHGRIAGVFLPNSADAQHHECSETGGLLIDVESYGLTLLPFGNFQVIRRVED